MKKNICCVVIALGIIGGIGSPCFAQTSGAKIAFRDLPASVQKAVRSDKDEIKRIEQFSFDGKTVYEVRLDKEDAADKLVYLSQDGTRIKDEAVRQQRQAERNKLHLKNLPKAVKATYKTQAGSAKMEDIDVETLNGKTVYDIDYNRAGHVETVRINEDGSLVRADRRARLNNRDLKQNNAGLPNAAAFDRSLSGSQKLDFESVPESVKRTARSVAGANRIEDAERGTLDGRTIYELAFKENGVHNELRVAEDGAIVQRIGGGTQIGVANAPVKMTTEQVPAPVRKAIAARVGAGEVNDIDRTTVGGKTVYEVGFKREKGGAQREIQIAEDGTIIREAAGARKK